MEPKKISFGFSKIKKPEKKIIPDSEQKQFIDCLEEKSIKVIGDPILPKEPLVIPMKANTLSTKEIMERISKEIESDIQDETQQEEKCNENVLQDKPKDVKRENETLEQMAAREIMESTAKDVKTKESNDLILPLPKDAPLSGEKESTLEDYDNIPVSDFGLAMLRGMGWKPGSAIGKNPKSVTYKHPTLRPKGLGLGADKVLKNNKNVKNGTTGQHEELKLIKGSFVKLTEGKEHNSYGTVAGFDEESGRLIVKLALKGTTVNISEFMVQVVTKREYEEKSRVINSLKYEEFKKKELESEKGESKESNYNKERSTDDHFGRRKGRDDLPRANQSSRGRGRTDSSSSPESHRLSRTLKHSDDYLKSKSKSRNHSSSSDSIESEPRRQKHSKKKHSRHDSSPESKKDNDNKKRKGKKKKRDKSRSPSSRKYKK